MQVRPHALAVRPRETLEAVLIRGLRRADESGSRSFPAWRPPYAGVAPSAQGATMPDDQNRGVEEPEVYVLRDGRLVREQAPSRSEVARNEWWRIQDPAQCVRTVGP